MASVDRWREVADRVVSSPRWAGYDLEDFAMVDAGRRRIVRVVVDSDNGVDLDEAAELSRSLSEAFDALDEADGGSQPPYTLEVTSPGLGRPLTQPRHFRRARGRLLAVTLTDGGAVQARVLGVTDSGVEVLTGRFGTDPDHLPFERIARAKVEVEFAPPSPAVAALLAADPRTSDVVARTSAEHAALAAGPDQPDEPPHDDASDAALDDGAPDDDPDDDDGDPADEAEETN